MYSVHTYVLEVWLARWQSQRWRGENISHAGTARVARDIIIFRWWVHRGERKISKFILFTFYISWHGVLYTTRRVRAYETIRWQRTHRCNTRLPLHARDVILPFVYNYSKTISSVCNNNIIFSAVKIISAECIAQPAGRSVPAASPSIRLAEFGRRGHTRSRLYKSYDDIVYSIRRRRCVLFFFFVRTRLISVYRSARLRI